MSSTTTSKVKNTSAKAYVTFRDSFVAANAKLGQLHETFVHEAGICRVTIGRDTMLAVKVLLDLKWSAEQAAARILEDLGTNPETGSPYTWSQVETFQIGARLAEDVPEGIRDRLPLTVLLDMRTVANRDKDAFVAMAEALVADADKAEKVGVPVRAARAAVAEWKAANVVPSTPSTDAEKAKRLIGKVAENKAVSATRAAAEKVGLLDTVAGAELAARLVEVGFLMCGRTVKPHEAQAIRQLFPSKVAEVAADAGEKAASEK